MSKKHFMQSGDDCLRCAVATLLDLELEDVPDLYDSEVKTYIDGWSRESLYDKWLSERGLMRFIFDIERDDENRVKIPAAPSSAIMAIGAVYKPGNDVAHAVVIRLNRSSIELIHDPMKNSIYDLNDLVQIEIIAGGIPK